MTYLLTLYLSCCGASQHHVTHYGADGYKVFYVENGAAFVCLGALPSLTGNGGTATGSACLEQPIFANGFER